MLRYLEVENMIFPSQNVYKWTLWAVSRTIYDYHAAYITDYYLLLFSCKLLPIWMSSQRCCLLWKNFSWFDTVLRNAFSQNNLSAKNTGSCKLVLKFCYFIFWCSQLQSSDPDINCALLFYTKTCLRVSYVLLGLLPGRRERLHKAQECTAVSFTG